MTQLNFKNVRTHEAFLVLDAVKLLGYAVP